jgi:hypothetical protein
MNEYLAEEIQKIFMVNKKERESERKERKERKS